MQLQQLIAAAAAAHAAGNLAATRGFCQQALALDARNADATHLLGLVARRSGDLTAAESLLRSSIASAPLRSEFHVNLGNLMRASGRPSEAAVCYLKALELDPGSRTARLAWVRAMNEAGEPGPAADGARKLLGKDASDAEAWVALGAAQRGLGEAAEAEGSLRKAIALRPDYPAARQNLGALLGSLGRAEEALAELDRAAAQGAKGRELQLNRARVLIELGRLPEADAALVTLLRQTPTDREAHLDLAKLRYMRGDPDYTGPLRNAAANLKDGGLWALLGDVLRRGGHIEEAVAVIEALIETAGWSPPLGSALAVLRQEQGQLDQAGTDIQRALHAQPDDPLISENFVSIQLQLGNAAAALPLIARERARVPLDQRWIAHEATAARLAGSSEYGRLYDYARFVRAYDLAVPAGYASMEAFNAALAEALRRRHTLNTHPLDQSLRFGTQTARSLLTDSDPAIVAFLRAAEDTIATYRREIGHDPSHPFLSRNQGPARFNGCWSVRLHREGFHVNHVHSKGWISSAYYVEVPAESADAERRSGWICFGAPRMPVPGADAALYLEPRPGRLVLFPSYLWHGTTPIHGPDPRMTIAFDVVPA